MSNNYNDRLFNKEEIEPPNLSHSMPERSIANQSKSTVPVDLEPKTVINPVIDRQEIINVSLLEERLIVDRHKRKIGEVSVRKKIETKMVQIPLRREILIIEQVGEETKQLAQIDLGLLNSNESNSEILNPGHHEYVITGEYASIELARQILARIASVANNLTSKPRIKLEILVDNPVQEKVYQNLLKKS